MKILTINQIERLVKLTLMPFCFVFALGFMLVFPFGPFIPFTTFFVGLFNMAKSLFMKLIESLGYKVDWYFEGAFLEEIRDEFTIKHFTKPFEIYFYTSLSMTILFMWAPFWVCYTAWKAPLNKWI